MRWIVGLSLRFRWLVLFAAGRGADHRPAGEPAKWGPWARRDSLQVGYRPLTDPAHLQQGHRPLRGAAAGAGAPDGGDAQFAHLGKPALDDASPLFDQPDIEDWYHL